MSVSDCRLGQLFVAISMFWFKSMSVSECRLGRLFVAVSLCSGLKHVCVRVQASLAIYIAVSLCSGLKHVCVRVQACLAFCSS